MIIISLFLFLLLLLLVKYPIIFKHYSPQKWSVGFGFVNNLKDGFYPQYILSYQQGKELSGADYIADPFYCKKGDTYYLFVEAAVDDFGRIDAFQSEDLQNWSYCGIALEENYHLSYPQIINYKGSNYLVPESKKGKKVSLYATDHFPLNWTEKRVLLEGKFLDPTLINHEGNYYLFVTNSDYKLFCYVANDLLDDSFRLHPISPLGMGEKMRPAGRPYKSNGNWILPVQSRKRGYGYAVHSLIIKELTPRKIRYAKGKKLIHPIPREPYFKHGVHHLDLQEHNGQYLFCIDGRVGKKINYWRWYGTIALKNLTGDLYSIYTITRNNLKSNKISE